MRGGAGIPPHGSRQPRRRMLVRGRITVFALAVAVVGLTDWLFASRSHSRGRDAPSVDAPSRSASDEPRAALLAPPEILSRIPLTRERAEALEAGAPPSAVASPRFVEVIPGFASRPDLRGPLRVEYSFDRILTREALAILRRGRVALGHVIVTDPDSGRVLVYVSSDPERFPPDRAYPAASLVKVITAAAALHHAPEVADQACRYVGNPYRLTRSRLDPPRSGRPVSLRRALSTSNNQCFAQLAVHTVGDRNLLGAIDRFGWLSPPAPLHPPGEVEAGTDPFDLGKLGCGLAGSRITPLHAAQLAATLAEGERVEPYWISEATDGEGRTLLVPRGRRTTVMTPALAGELREMLVDTTVRGTARRAFRTRRGPLLGPIRVAGKTGSLSGTDPKGRYEWFVGVAPADEPTIAIAVVLVQGELWWMTPAQVAAELLKVVFCPQGVCGPEAVQRWLDPEATPLESVSSQQGRGADTLRPGGRRLASDVR